MTNKVLELDQSPLSKSRSRFLFISFFSNDNPAHSLIMLRRKSKVLGKSSSKGSLYTFVPMKTRRGKDTYKEADAKKLYSTQSQPSTPKTSRIGQDVAFSNYSEACNLPTLDWNDEQTVFRHTKV